VRADGKDLVPIGVDPVSPELMRDDDPDQQGQTGGGSTGDDDK